VRGLAAVVLLVGCVPPVRFEVALKPGPVSIELGEASFDARVTNLSRIRSVVVVSPEVWTCHVSIDGRAEQTFLEPPDVLRYVTLPPMPLRPGATRTMSAYEIVVFGGGAGHYRARFCLQLLGRRIESNVVEFDVR
jgi:hypothetical protein